MVGPAVDYLYVALFSKVLKFPFEFSVIVIGTA